MAALEALLGLSLIANGILLWLVRKRTAARPPRHMEAAIAFALKRPNWRDGRRFLKLFRMGSEEAVVARFPEWREFRNRFGKIEKDQKQ